MSESSVSTVPVDDAAVRVFAGRYVGLVAEVVAGLRPGGLLSGSKQKPGVASKRFVASLPVLPGVGVTVEDTTVVKAGDVWRVSATVVVALQGPVRAPARVPVAFLVADDGGFRIDTVEARTAPQPRQATGPKRDRGGDGSPRQLRDAYRRALDDVALRNELIEELSAQVPALAARKTAITLFVDGIVQATLGMRDIATVDGLLAALRTNSYVVEWIESAGAVPAVQAVNAAAHVAYTYASTYARSRQAPAEFDAHANRVAARLSGDADLGGEVDTAAVAEWSRQLRVGDGNGLRLPVAEAVYGAALMCDADTAEALRAFGLFAVDPAKVGGKVARLFPPSAPAVEAVVESVPAAAEVEAYPEPRHAPVLVAA